MKPRLAFVTALLAFGLVATACSSQAEDSGDAPQRTITVTGQGEARAAPDLARLSAGVRTQAGEARQALAANTQAMNKVFAAMRQLGIADKDMQTSNFSVRPIYARRPPGQPQTEPAKIIGYQVSNQVSVVVRDLAKLGADLDAFVGAGANQLYGVSFDIADPDPLLDKARQAAVKNAMHKAELLTKAAGVKLGKLLTMSESSSSGPVPKLALARAAMETAPVPTAAGEQAVEARVNLTFAIE
jgi:uncharacterized protein YggE